MSHFLIIGLSFSSLRKYIEEHDHTYTVLVDVKKFKKNVPNQVACDFTDEKSVTTVLKTISGQIHIDGVLVTYENFVLPAAKIAEQLGLPGLPVESAKACTDKDLMRQAFAKAPEPISPDFQVVTSWVDAEKFAKDHSFPLILKPANLAKSLLVTKSKDLDELKQNYARTEEHIGETYQKYAPSRRPKLIIEEFLEGSIHSVDAFIDSEGVPHVLEQVVDYQTGYDIGFDDNFHYSRLLPSELPDEDVRTIRHTAEVGCRALGMKNSPAHIEIILTPRGPRIVEIGARNGGYRERMHGLANGIDIDANALRLSLGQKPDIKASRNNPCAVLELFPREPGMFQGVTDEEALQKLPSLVYFKIKQVVGDYVGKAGDGYKMCAIIMLHNSDSEQFQKDLDFVNQKVKVITTERS